MKSQKGKSRGFFRFNYVETQTPTTNANGLVSIEMGTGTTSDDFSAIDWANGPYFILTETDPAGDASYTITGTSQLLSVPYALHAKTAENGITAQQANDITANTAKVGYTDALVSANADVVANTAKVGITTEQATAISDNTAKTGITAQQASDIIANNAKVGITTAQADEIAVNTAKVGYTDDLVSSNANVAANTAKVGVSPGTAAGQMQYWDGTAWVTVAATENEGATLQMISGVPTWTGGTPPTVPGTPTIGTAIAGDGQASVSFTAPASDGGSTIISYTATSSPGGITGTLNQAGSGTITVTGLTNGTAYTFTITATNSVGTSAASAASNSVTPDGPLTDINGNVYQTVTIGTQQWMAENLKTTKYNDGTGIPIVTDGTAWGNLTTPGYCWYDNDQATYGDTYGALYNWYTVETGNLCPIGWHVPTDAEWKTLEMYLGMSQANADLEGGSRGTDEGGKLKETGTTHWNSPNTGATNESGFTALPGGIRALDTFYSIGMTGLWWVATENSPSTGLRRFINNSSIQVGRYPTNKETGMSVRCLRD